MKYRFLKSAFALVLTSTLLLSGCGSAGGNTTAAPAGGTTAAPAGSTSGAKTESKPAAKTVIEYWHVNAETQGGATVEELVKKFNAQSDSVEVVARYNPDMYKGLMQNLQAEIATGKTPAIVQVGWAFIDYFSNNFKYQSPQDVVDKYFPEDKTFLKDNFLPNILALAENSAKSQVGIPYSLSNPVLYLNKDLLKAAGLSEEGPKTWQELREFAKQIKEKTGKYGFYMQEPADNWATQALLESNGARFLSTVDNKLKASFASPEGIEAYQFLADMINVDKSALHISWDEGTKSFVDGNVAMLYTTIARRASVQKGASFNLGAVGSPAWGDKPVRIPSGGAFLAITAVDEAQIKAAWEFEKFLYSVESVAAWTIGTGYVPPRTGVAEAENGLKKFFAENTIMNAATNQMDKMVPWASFPGDAGLEAEQILLDTRDQILGGNEKAEVALPAAQEKINKLIG